MKAGNIAPPNDVLALHLKILDELLLSSNTYLKGQEWFLRNNVPGVKLLTGSIDITELSCLEGVIKKHGLLFHIYPCNNKLDVTFFVPRYVDKKYTDAI